MPVETGTVCEQIIQVRGGYQCRRVELTLHSPTDSGDSSLMFWSNLPESISAQLIAALYRRCWSIEGMFQRLEAILESEIETLCSPKAALLGFANAILAYNILAVLKRSVEQAHRETQAEGWKPRSITWRFRSGVGMRECRLRCSRNIFQSYLWTNWPSACWSWPETSNQNKLQGAPAAPRCLSLRLGGPRCMRTYQQTV